MLWFLAVSGVVVGSLLPSSSPPIEMIDLLHLSDKLLHSAAYAVLSFLPALHENRWMLAGLILGLLSLGVLLEFGQSYFSDRMFDLHDMIANAVGLVAGLVVALPFRARMAV
ncbi:MAG TPA: VanZ family protein [Bryobacteraceae bacterium]|nr:VanZ family protein [Bryobacteraceae bacterium]